MRCVRGGYRAAEAPVGTLIVIVLLLFVASALAIARYARQMTIVDYGDSHTRRLLGNTNEITFGLIPPGQFRAVGKVCGASRAWVVVTNCSLGARSAPYVVLPCSHQLLLVVPLLVWARCGAG